ncbi:DUF4249 domain-containing protein [Chitinophaga tropicalis]|nr:DUF4249 domain-containing protein [Chitinophaga tropicalis]
MRNSFIYTILGTALLLGTACEKEITPDLGGNDSRYVVEGVLTDEAGGCSVKISRTKDFYSDNSFDGVSGAIVKIYHGTDTTVLAETSTGVYTAPELTGSSGNTYGMTVNIAGEVITATSIMPSKVNMDSLYITKEEVFGDTQNQPTVQFQDPAGVANYYRFTLYVNDYKSTNIYVRNDDLTDGNLVNANLFSFDSEEGDPDYVDSGDQITVEMMNIDPFVYKYFFSLSQSATGENQSASPANPVSNLKGNALGYFSAHTIQRKTITVP